MKLVYSMAAAAILSCTVSQVAYSSEGSLEPEATGFQYPAPEEVFQQASSQLVSHAGGNTCCASNSCCEPWYAQFRSDQEFDSFMEPVTNSVFFEDPRSMTRARFLFLNQQIPDGSILQGGDLQLYGLQVTVALSERLTFLANKDGFITIDTGLLGEDEGWADLGTGLKYVLIRDTCNDFLLSAGFLYEWSQGSRGVFQGNGDGVWNFFLTTGKKIGCNSHFIGTAGWHLPNHGGQETESMFWSLHLDHSITNKLAALWEMTGIHYVDAGRRSAAAFDAEGGDLINLGTVGVSGNTVVTTALGLHYKVNCSTSIAAAYEIPVTSREDLLENRTTVYLRWQY